MQAITSKNFIDSLDDALVSSLNLTRTLYTTPDPSIGVIPGTLSGTEWSYNMGIEGPQVHLAHTLVLGANTFPGQASFILLQMT
jgi:hypothetical protein